MTKILNFKIFLLLNICYNDETKILRTNFNNDCTLAQLKSNPSDKLTQGLYLTNQHLKSKQL